MMGDEVVDDIALAWYNIVKEKVTVVTRIHSQLLLGRTLAPPGQQDAGVSSFWSVQNNKKSHNTPTMGMLVAYGSRS